MNDAEKLQALLDGRKRVLVWYSGGAASAVALKMALEKFGTVEPVYCNTRSEHPDNERFRRDVENWLGVRILEISSDNYHDVDDVIKKRGIFRVPNVGAPCTTELKKVPRLKYQQPEDKHIFGYTYEEGVRIARLMSANWDLRIECPLFSARLKKQDCLDIISDAGIDIPIMYRLGFNNNNCLGCVKSEGPDYWLLVQQHFPEVFKKRIQQEEELGFALCRWRGKPVFLKDLKPHMKSTKAQKKLSCDFVCGTEGKA